MDFNQQLNECVPPPVGVYFVEYLEERFAVSIVKWKMAPKEDSWLIFQMFASALLISFEWCYCDVTRCVLC